MHSLSDPVLQVRGLHFTYGANTRNPIHALRGIDLDVYPGEYLVILGHNGSGKSTLARHFNALLRPTVGEVKVRGLDSRDPANTLAIRRLVGMVFQVPDNQIVASIVEEDVAFGPENLGVPEAELHRRVDWALEIVGMSDYRHREPHRLSAGQKQRVALAGVMAMLPEVLVLDEATSMLDPEGRLEVLAAVRRLNQQGVTVVAITHLMDEAAEASRVVVMEAGKIVQQGTPRELLTAVDLMRELQLDVPQVTELAYLLNRMDPSFPANLLHVSELAAQVAERARPVTGSRRVATASGGDTDRAGPALVQVAGLQHSYLRGTPLEVTSLRGVELEIHKGEALGILGRSGAGKSTLVQHLNGLFRPRNPGQVRVYGHDLSDTKLDVRQIRQKVGLVFQSPEQQLFERLVGDDIAFGPKQMGMARPERRERVRWAMEMVGLDFDAFRDRFTFSLSGGEMRKVALAGVLALQPEVLILDESTSGLDPRSRRELLQRLTNWHRQQGLTLVFVSPSMEDVAGLVEQICVMADGRVAMLGPTRTIFGQGERLGELGLSLPQVAAVAHASRSSGIVADGVPLTVAEGAEWIWRILSS